MRVFLLEVLAFIFVILASGCADDSKQFKVELYADEQVSVDDPVYVDGVAMGEVVSVLGEQVPLAMIRVSGDEVLDRFRPGVYRDSQRGRINIQTHKAKLEAAPMREGELISSGGLILDWSNSKTLLAIGIALAGTLVLAFAFKVFFKAFLIILTLALSVALAWITYPIGVPYVERVYAQTDTAAVEAETSTVPNSPMGNGIGRVEDQIKRFLVNRPDPQAVSFGSLAFCYFVMLTFVLGRALGSLGRKA